MNHSPHKNAVFASVLALVFPLVAATAQTPGTEPNFEPFEADGVLGLPVAGQLADIRVPLDHFDSEDQRRIEVSVARFATDHPRPGPPIFFLAGGPGGSGVDGAAITATHPQIRLLEHADVIGLDQRGTGRSRPSLTGAPPQEFASGATPPDEPMTRARYIEIVRATIRSFQRDASRLGVDLDAFDTEQSVEDLEIVRRAFGYDRIVLYGASYGTHLGLAYLRRYPERVERAVFLHVEGPGHTWKLPSTAQAVLERVTRLEARSRTDGGLSLTERLAALLDRLENQPLMVKETKGAGRHWAIGAFELRAEIAARLGSVRDISTIPMLLTQLERGDGSAILDIAAELRRPFVHPLLIAMDCASGGSAERRARIARERTDPANLLRDAILLPVPPEACDELDGIDLGDEFRAAFQSGVPMLLVSGDLDARTPPSNVEELKRGFTAAIHVLALNASHDSRQLMAPEFRDILQRFLRGEDLPDTTLQLPPPLFERAAAVSDGSDAGQRGQRGRTEP